MERKKVECFEDLIIWQKLSNLQRTFIFSPKEKA